MDRPLQTTGKRARCPVEKSESPDLGTGEGKEFPSDLSDEDVRNSDR
jgi:hypothetical protein